MITRSLRLGLVLAMIGLALTAAPAGAATGARPDKTFGGGRGWVTTVIPGSSSPVAYAAVVTPTNRIVAAGQAPTSDGNSQAFVVRYQGNGRLDPTFGTAGIFMTSLPAADGPFWANAIARQSSTGGLVVAGAYGTGSILLLRLTPAGTIDPTFGTAGTGIVTLPVEGYASSLAIDGDGRILVGSSDANVQGRPMIVARFTPNGTLDTTFGQNGIVKLLFWDAIQAAGTNVAALHVGADGNVTGVGHIDYIGGDGHGSAGIFRLSPSGALVPGFGSGGHTEIAYLKPTGASSSVYAQWFPGALKVDLRRRIVVTGGGDAAAGPALLTARLTPSGALDTSYGALGSGWVVTNGLPSGTSQDDTTCGAAVNARNAVTSGVGASLVQLTSTGAPNTRFGPGGIVNIGAPAQVSLNAVASAGSGRIVLAGVAGSSVYVARYLTP